MATSSEIKKAIKVEEINLAKVRDVLNEAKVALSVSSMAIYSCMVSQITIGAKSLAVKKLPKILAKLGFSIGVGSNTDLVAVSVYERLMVEVEKFKKRTEGLDKFASDVKASEDKLTSLLSDLKGATA